MILAVENAFFIADELRRYLSAAELGVLGPVSSNGRTDPLEQELSDIAVLAGGSREVVKKLSCLRPRRPGAPGGRRQTSGGVYRLTVE